MSSRPSAPTRVYLEVGSHRVFACALDWPGWCRSGRDETQALEALEGTARRYASVAGEAGLELGFHGLATFDVVERLPGSATTDFGAPDKVATSDAEPVSRREAERLAALVAASWTVFDRVVRSAPAELRKGPRGGGRDRDAIVLHVLGAEAAYARKLGIRHRPPDPADASAVAALRDALTSVLREATSGTPPVEKGWPVRYAARRIAWHVLDHAWEIEDRGARPR